MSKLLFQNKRLGNKGYNLKVPRNDQGHFKVVLGAVNTFNNQNELYIDKNLKELLEEDGYLSVANRIKSGLMGGEAMHPRREPGMTDAQFMHRNLQIDNVRRAYTIHSLETEQTKVRENGVDKNVTLIWGWIECEAGDLGDKLKARLLNEAINVVFSIRCFARETVRGNNIWYITKLITFDWVDIPGVKYAGKDGIDGLVLKTEDGLNIDDYDSVVVDTALLDTMSNDSIICKTESAQYIPDLKAMCIKNDDTRGFVFNQW